MFIIAIIASKGSVAAGLKVFYLETVMHYHQNPYVRNITGLHRNYEHKRQIKRQADLSLRWEHSHIVGLS